MRSRCLLQPTLAMAANTIQEARFAKPVGHGKSAVVIVNVYRNQAGGITTFDIQTASHTGVAATSGTFWVDCDTGTNTIAAGTTGAVKFKLADLGEVIRYNVTNSSWSSGIDFDITVYFADT